MPSSTPHPDSHSTLDAPIHLPDSIIRSSTVNFPKFPSRPLRHRKSSVSTPRQRRPESFPHAFDALPWISVLDNPPDVFSPCDIADLSQLPIPPSPNSRAPGFGPVRRRRVSSRTDPLRCLATNPACSDILTEFPTLDRRACITPNPPVTPPPCFDPSRISFYRLMPVPANTNLLMHEMYEHNIKLHQTP
ncbi:hypothetical protein AMATHDRAFT_2177 [Amanita thiersii Skay4041]|uniref:Uncharacterized protein n=1 Tax=Amanita thiersii Skay4041 TaxID=703135 RepID=A0A2A9NXA9_9AGAR|nr:hypothetical protein AMATHDRAFT_2177 [Amanita thiersii Skay4041]